MSTTTELATAQSRAEIVKLSDNRVTPDTMQGVAWLADLTVKAGMAPRGIETKEKLAIALTAGFELGLTYTQSLRGIMVVNNRPCVWGDVALSLVRKSSMCIGIEERVDGEGETAVAVCIGKRRHAGGSIEEQQRTFNVREAKHAGLWGKQGPWTSYPKRMMQMRARAFLLRDLFPDLLNGMDITEEVQDHDAGEATTVTVAGDPQTAMVAPTSPIDEITDVEPEPGQAAPESQPLTPELVQKELGATVVKVEEESPTATPTPAEVFHDELTQALTERGIPAIKGTLRKIREAYKIADGAEFSTQQQIAVLSDINTRKFDYLIPAKASK